MGSRPRRLLSCAGPIPSAPARQAPHVHARPAARRRSWRRPTPVVVLSAIGSQFAPVAPPRCMEGDSRRRDCCFRYSSLQAKGAAIRVASGASRIVTPEALHLQRLGADRVPERRRGRPRTVRLQHPVTVPPAPQIPRRGWPPQAPTDGRRPETPRLPKSRRGVPLLAGSRSAFLGSSGRLA
jgi:hypothetical protein